MYFTDAQIAEMQRNTANGGTTLVLSDFDGTQCELDDKNPDNVAIDPRCQQAMRVLPRLPLVKAGFLSGRDIPALQELVGINGLIYVGYHGLGRADKFPARLSDVTFVPEARPFIEQNRILGQRVGQVLSTLGLSESVIIEDKVVSLAINIGGVGTKAIQKKVAADIERGLRSFAEQRGYRYTYDLTTIEFRPNVPRNKGTGLIEVVRSVGASFVVYFGDSGTDLDALTAIGWLRDQGIGGIGVVAERDNTDQKLLAAADLRVPGIPGVRDCLVDLTTKLRRRV